MTVRSRDFTAVTALLIRGNPERVLKGEGKTLNIFVERVNSRSIYNAEEEEFSKQAPSTCKRTLVPKDKLIDPITCLRDLDEVVSLLLMKYCCRTFRPAWILASIQLSVDCLFSPTFLQNLFIILLIPLQTTNNKHMKCIIASILVFNLSLWMVPALAF